MDAGLMDMQILPSNDGYGSWFLLIVVSMVEGVVAAENDWPSAVGYFFTCWNSVFGNTWGVSSAFLVAYTYPHGENFE